MSVDFLDSNVLVYLFDRKDARRRTIAEGLLRGVHENGNGVISWQVVQETLNVVTRKLRPGLNAEEAQTALSVVLAPLWRVMPSATLFAKALQLQERLGFTFYDALIVASAIEAKCKRLLTEDLQHGQRIEGLRVENPFRA